MAEVEVPHQNQPNVVGISLLFRFSCSVSSPFAMPLSSPVVQLPA